MILVGHIGHAHGIKGLVKLQSYTSPPDAIGRYKALTLKDGKSIRIEVISTAGGLLARIDGISDRTQAETLRNTDLFINRTELPKPEPGEFYHADLVGLLVIGQDQVALGNVLAVHNFGAGDIIEIKPESGMSFMHPFNKQFVPFVDLDSGVLTIADYSESE